MAKTKARKQVHVEAYPARFEALARYRFHEARDKARDAADRVAILRDDVGRFEAERQIALSKEGNSSERFITNEQANRLGSGSGHVVIYFSHPEDPNRPPHDLDDILEAEQTAAEAAKAADVVQAEWLKEREKGQFRDVVAECWDANTDYYWRVDRFPEIVRGDPIPVEQVLAWPRHKLEGLLSQRVVGEIPPSAFK